MYESFYKFKNAPFRLSPDPNFFFGSKGHNRALAYLRYGLQQKEGFIVITGSPGTGKTTLSRALLQEVGREKIIVAEINTTHLDADDVLRMVAASFGLEFENAPKAVLLKRLENHFISRHRAGYHILLIVDESQNLPFESMEELRMLSNFYLGKNALIQIFLLGQEQFRKSLYSQKMEQLRQRVVASCHLEPLDQVETREYITHRLSLVGWKNDPQISDRAFVRIFSLTRGVPRRINTFCDRLFLFGSLDDIHQLKDTHVKDVAKELMYEVSAKNVELSDIKVGETGEGISDSNIETETLDSEHLDDYSDELPDVPLPEMSVPSAEVEEITADKKTNKEDDSSIPSGGTERQSLRVVTHTHNTSVAESFEPISAIDSGSTYNKPEWWKLVALSVDYLHNPDSYPALNSSKNALAEGIVEMLKIATGKKILQAHKRIDELSDVSDEVLKQACIHYIKNVFLTDKADYYRRLGVHSESSLDLIRSHYRYLFRLLQSDSEMEANEQDEMYIRRINQAFSTLRSLEKRNKYDDFLATIKNNKQEKRVDSDDDVQSVDLEFEAELPKSIENKTYDVPSLKNEKKSNSIWMFILIPLFGLAGAFYFFQPNFNEVKENISGVISESKPVETLDILETVPDDSPNIAKIQDKIESSVVSSKVKSDDLNVVVAKVDNSPKIKKADPEISKLQKKKAEIKRRIEKAKNIKALEESRVSTVTELENIPTPKAEKSIIVPKEIPEFIIPKVEPEELVKVEKEKFIEPLVISDKELSVLMHKFSLSYEDGKLNQFMALFSKDVLTNNDENWQDVRTDYGSLFKNTEMRVIEIPSMTWDKTKNTAFGEGDFVVTVLRNKADEIQKFTGRINLEVVKVRGKLKIIGMFHAYGDDDN